MTMSAISLNFSMSSILASFPCTNGEPRSVK